MNPSTAIPAAPISLGTSNNAPHSDPISTTASRAIAPSTSPSLRARLAQKFALTTPQGIRFEFVSLGAIATLFCALSIATLRNQYQAIQVIGEDVATGILTAQRIEESLAAIDANLVNLLLLPPQQQAEAQQALQTHQQKLANDLVHLAQASAQGKGLGKKLHSQERRLLTILQVELGSYLQSLERAQTLRQTGDQAGAIATYRDSVNRLETRLLPAATALRITQNKTLETIYRPQKQLIREGHWGLVLLGLGLIFHLLFLQIFLSRRTHRTLNLGLVFATLLLLGTVGQVIQSLNQSVEQLDLAKSQTFPGLQNLRISRNLAYRAHSGLNRALLDTEDSAGAIAAFRNQVAQLVAVADPATLSKTANSSNSIPLGMLGLSTTPLNLSEEQGAMRAVVQAFIDYQTLTEKVQALQTQNQGEAIALATGYREGELNSAFEAFKAQQQRVIEIHQAAFDQNLIQSQRAFAGLQWKVPVALGLVLSLSAAGLYPRLREYKL